MLHRLKTEGVPSGIPWVISEYGFSAYSGQAMVEPQAALLQADIVAHFLSAGGGAAYMFGIGPGVPFAELQGCAGYGAMAPFLADSNGQARQTLPSFHFARLIAHDWLMPGHGLHRSYSARLSPTNGARLPGPAELVVAYAVQRPDGRLATLVINRSAKQAYSATLATRNPALRRLSGRIEVFQYGANQYRWKAEGPKGHPIRDRPPAHFQTRASAAVGLPPTSITVIVVSQPN